jgi:hypothetical protein
VRRWLPKKFCIPFIFLVFLGGLVRAFLGPTIFPFYHYWFKESISQCGDLEQFRLANSFSSGTCRSRFFQYLIGVPWSCSVACSIFLRCFFYLKLKKADYDPKIGEPVMQSLTEGLKFVFNNKTVLAITLDYGGSPFEAVRIAAYFAQDILKVGPERFGFLRAAPAVMLYHHADYYVRSCK